MTDPERAGADAPVLADGIASYVELFRQQPPADTLAGMRLTGDLAAHRFTGGAQAAIARFDTAIALPGREIAVRIHVPAGHGPLPAICYFHGGGFSHGSIESFSGAAEALAEASGAIVASVQYRRLPDSDYRAAQDDCDAAFAWLTRHAATLGGDPDRIVLAGDSVGALFALNRALRSRGASPHPAALLLFYGAFALRREDPAYHGAADPLLTPERIAAFVELYEGCGGPAQGPAPLDRTDLGGLPFTLVVAAEHDPLAVDSICLRKTLEAAGVPARLHVAPGMIHGFLRATGVSTAAREELRQISETLWRKLQDAA